ncbi:MAG: RDD family protein [Halobacteriales archaeon]|nr:RDD family protein [Halobacteriales archaeon]
MNDEELKRAARVLLDAALGFALVVVFVRVFLPARPLDLPTGASSAGVVLIALFGSASFVALGTRHDERRLVAAMFAVVGTLAVASLVVLPAADTDLSVTALGVGVVGVVLAHVSLHVGVSDRVLLRRGVSSAVDGVVAVALWYVTVWTVAPAVGLRTPTGATWGGIVSVVVVIFFWSAVVRVPFEAYDGRTPGKRIAGVRVTDRDGGEPSLRAVVLRNTLRPLDSLPFGYFVGVAYAVRSDGRRIGDAVAGTRVVRDGRTEEATEDG